MFRHHQPPQGRSRRATILMVTILLLTLFLVVGICFVLFAENQANSARVYREAMNHIDDASSYPTPEELMGYAMGSLIYDVPDTGSEYSAVRGHSLARNIYGWNYTLNPDGTMNSATPTGLPFNATPYNGSGRLVMTAGNPFGFDNSKMVNYTYYPNDGFKRDPERELGGLFTGGQNVPYTYPDLNNMYLGAVDGSGRILAKSFWRDQPAPAPLGAQPVTLDPANTMWTDPTLSPIYKYLTLRPRPADQLLPIEPQTQAYVNAQIAAGNIIPAPRQATIAGVTYQGDVSNLLPGTNRFDSVWVDLDFPTVTLQRTLRKVKPLFAFLVVDLDNRVNLNVHGNVREGNNVNAGEPVAIHASHQGWGTWEVNPRRVLDPAMANAAIANDYLNLFRGNAVAAAPNGGRFGIAPGAQHIVRWPPGPVPPAGPFTMNQSFPFPDAGSRLFEPFPQFSPALRPSHHYALMDWDASSLTGMPSQPTSGPIYPANGKARMVLPLAPSSATTFMSNADFGDMNTGRFNDGTRWYGALSTGGYPPSRTPPAPPAVTIMDPGESLNHPSLFNPFNINRNGATGANQDRLFPIADMKRLLAPDNTIVPFPLGDVLQSELGKVMPNAFTLNAKLRNLVTTHSMDFDLAGAQPGIPNASLYGMNPAQPWGPTNVPIGLPSSFTALLPQRANPVQPGGDLRNNDWRSNLPDFGRVDLTRPLTPYPGPTPGTSFPGTPGAAVNYHFDTTSLTGIGQQFRAATRDRVSLAYDIFRRFIVATGAVPPENLNPATVSAGGDYPNNVVSPGSALFEALRYLAQLSVNIVDYIDEDDYITAMNWLAVDVQLNFGDNNPPLPTTIPPSAQAGWVFGTERPRLVINEVYAQIENQKNDPNIMTRKYALGGPGDPDTSSTLMTPDPAFQPPDPVKDPTYKAQQPYRVNFWVELHNPLKAGDPTLTDSGAARLQMDPSVSLPAGQRAMYQIVIRNKVTATDVRAVWNITGDPDYTTGGQNPTTPGQDIDARALDFQYDDQAPGIPAWGTPNIDPFLVFPSNGQYASSLGPNPAQNDGYFTLGPDKQSLSDPTNPSNYPGFPRDRSTTGSPHTLPANFQKSTFSVAFQPSITVPGQPPRDSKLWCDLPNTTDLTTLATPGSPLQPSVFLRRLANPYLPISHDPGSPFFNPYVTVDYVGLDSTNPAAQKVVLQDAVLYDANGPRDGQMGRPQRKPVDQRVSFGRRQPFRATGLTVQAPIDTDAVSGTPGTPQFWPQQTFARQNGRPDTISGPGAAGPTLDVSTVAGFQWLPHLDRQVVNVMELLDVSVYRPHELTQEFIRDPLPASPQPNTSFMHRLEVPVRQANTRLYRGLELLGTRDRTVGIPFGGKVPGRININTVYDAETFQALCDAATGNYFSDDNTLVQNTWAGIVGQRTPTGAPNWTTDRPFSSLAVLNPPSPAGDPQYPYPPGLPPPAAQTGLDRTLVRDLAPGAPAVNGTSPNLFTVAPGGAAAIPMHPYIQSELLRKIFANVTTRSNVFAVWVTVGWFEVRDDLIKPSKLGREINVANRNRFFAVVDRTNLALDLNDPRMQSDKRPILFPYEPVVPNQMAPVLPITGTLNQTGPGLVRLHVPAYTGMTVRDTIDHYGAEYSGTSGFKDTLAPGRLLFIDVGLNAEPVSIVAVNAATQTVWVNTAKSHNAGCRVSTQRLGNPGPQPLPIDCFGTSGDTRYPDTVIPFRQILQ